MSSQITNLLDLIKNNEHKKVTQEDEKNERSLTPTRKTRAYQ